MDKSVCRELESQALGEHIDGKRGVIGPPLDFVHRLLSITFVTLEKESVTQKWLQVVAGRWARAIYFQA